MYISYLYRIKNSLYFSFLYVLPKNLRYLFTLPVSPGVWGLEHIPVHAAQFVHMQRQGWENIFLRRLHSNVAGKQNGIYNKLVFCAWGFEQRIGSVRFACGVGVEDMCRA